MSSTPIIYTSSDGSAPVLDGQVGSILTVLRAILVAGYGAKSAAGWTEPFTASGNIGVFRNNSSVGTGAYFRFDDAATGAGGAKTALVRGYRAMTALSSGSDGFPKNGQEAAGLYVRKSEAASSTARAWWAIACRKWIYLIIDSNSGGLDQGACYFFGDIESIRPSDAYHAAIMAGRIADPTTSQDRSLAFGTCTAFNVAPVGTSTGLYLMGEQSQIASAIGAACVSPYGIATTVGGSTGFAYPHPPNNGVLLGKLAVIEAAYTLRGWMPALYAPWHNQVLTDLTSLPNVPASGTTLLSKRCRPRAASTSFANELLFDTTTAH